jgi:hypothetical protein
VQRTDIELVFVAAEDILAQRYASRSCVLKLLQAREGLAAYERTASREEQGVRALRAGSYRRGKGGR